METQTILASTLQTGMRHKHAMGLDHRSSEGPQAYFEELREEVAPLREALLHHSIYTEVNSLERLREFMQAHAFAVWDFMSLVKRLQREVTCLSLPWLPPARANVARFANEVVLGEETDMAPDEKPTSHFEMYLRAMDEIGADTAVIKEFIKRVAQGERWPTALTRLNVPSSTIDFVNETLLCAIQGSVVEVASYFFFGREDVIPDMFKRLLKLWGKGAAEVPHFAYYLERHIELDGDSHGPWAQEMLMALAGNDRAHWKEATRAAKRAMIARIKLWDSIRDHLKNGSSKQQLTLSVM